MAPDFSVYDSNGERFQLSTYKGKAIILCFLREASCPFCNLRVHELIEKHDQWLQLGIELVAVFSSSNEKVSYFSERLALPFRTIADPELKIYESYGIEKSDNSRVKALTNNSLRIIKGLLRGALPHLRDSNAKVDPADCLIGFNGKVVDIWYGKDAADSMPMKRLDHFALKVKNTLEREEKRNKALNVSKEIERRALRKNLEFSESLNLIEASLLDDSIKKAKSSEQTKTTNDPEMRV